jgi:hypothetical protein
LVYINKAIQHTPTVSDLYLQKAKVYQYMGNRGHASALSEEAFNLDTADRNLNYEAAKYKLKNGEYDRANELMGLFSYDVWNGKDLNSHEMQTLWYEQACYQQFYSNGNHRLALKEIGWMEKHFETFIEDCLEFNNFSLRKGTINHQMQLVEQMRDMYSGPYPKECCLGTLKAISKIQKHTEAQI